MTRCLRFGVLFSLLAVLIGCNGGAQTQPRTGDDGRPVAVPDDGPGGSVIAGPAGDAQRHDVSPVREPGLVVLHARWKSPQSTLETLARFTSLPAGSVSKGTNEIAREVVDEMLGRNVDGDAFAAVIDPAAPVDVIVLADVSRPGPLPEPRMGLALGLRSLSAAQQAVKGRPASIGEGLWRIGPEEKWGNGCALAAASGRTPARLVCAEKARDLEVLGPYMARNLPTVADADSDIHVELLLRGLLDKYGRQWASQARGLPVFAEEFKVGIPRFDAALMDAAASLAAEADELIKDADKIVLDASVSPGSGARLAVQLHFAGKRSWFVQTVTADASQAGPAPGIFWRAPSESDTVNYARMPDPARYEPVLATGRALLEGWLEHEKVGTAADRAALAKLVRIPFRKGAANVVAQGHFASKAMGASPTPAQLLEQTVGWTLVGVEEGGAELRAWLEDAVRTYNRPSLQSLMKKTLASDAEHLPKVRTVPLSPQLGGRGLAVEIVVPNLDAEMAIPMELPPPPLPPHGAPSPPPIGGPVGVRPPKPPGKGGNSVALHVLLMVDGDKSWIGVAANKDELVKLMAALKSGGEPLAKRPGLERLKREIHSSGTVTSLRGLLSYAMPSLWFLMIGRIGGGNDPLEEIKQAMDRTPSKASSPILAFGDVRDGARPSMTLTVEVPSGALKDAGALVTQLMTMTKQAP